MMFLLLASMIPNARLTKVNQVGEGHSTGFTRKRKLLAPCSGLSRASPVPAIGGATPGLPSHEGSRPVYSASGRHLPPHHLFHSQRHPADHRLRGAAETGGGALVL